MMHMPKMKLTQNQHGKLSAGLKNQNARGITSWFNKPHKLNDMTNKRSTKFNKQPKHLEFS